MTVATLNDKRRAASSAALTTAVCGSKVDENREHRHQDKYGLIRDMGETRAWTKVMNHKSRTVLVRCFESRWQPCGNFEKSDTIKRPSVESRLAARRTEAASTLIQPQPIPRLRLQTSASPDTEEPAREVIKTAAIQCNKATHHFCKARSSYREAHRSAGEVWTERRRFANSHREAHCRRRGGYLGRTSAPSLDHSSRHYTLAQHQVEAAPCSSNVSKPSSA